jgi:hypothetical protein
MISNVMMNNVNKVPFQAKKPKDKSLLIYIKRCLEEGRCKFISQKPHKLGTDMLYQLPDGRTVRSEDLFIPPGATALGTNEPIPSQHLGGYPRIFINKIKSPIDLNKKKEPDELSQIYTKNWGGIPKGWSRIIDRSNSPENEALLIDIHNTSTEKLLPHA